MFTVVEETTVTDEIEAAKLKWARAHDAWETISWVIARDPEVGTALVESGKTRALTLQGAVSIELPTVTIVYECDGRTITVTAIRFGQAKSMAAGRA